MTFRRTRSVFVGEDDASGLIYFPTYYTYMSEAEQLMFDELGLPMADQIRRGTAMPVVHSECDYIAPVRAGDVLTQVVELEAGGRSTITLWHEFRDASTGQVRARARLVRALTSLEAMTSVPIPDDIRAQLTGHPAAG